MPSDKFAGKITMQKTDNKKAMFKLIEQWKESGLSQKIFCEQLQIRYHVFHYWYKRYKTMNGAEVNTVSAFVPLHISQTVSTDPFAEIIFADGKRLLLNQFVDVQFLRNLLS
jgi:hypothetical protein